MCNYKEVIEQDVKEMLRVELAYGEESVKQFWALEGEAIIAEHYEYLSLDIKQQAAVYGKLIGETEL